MRNSQNNSIYLKQFITGQCLQFYYKHMYQGEYMQKGISPVNGRAQT